MPTLSAVPLTAAAITYAPPAAANRRAGARDGPAVTAVTAVAAAPSPSRLSEFNRIGTNEHGRVSSSEHEV